MNNYLKEEEKAEAITSMIILIVLIAGITTMIIAGIYEYYNPQEEAKYKIEIVDKYEQLDGGFTFLGTGTHSNINYYIVYKIYPLNDIAKEKTSWTERVEEVRQCNYRKINIGDTRITNSELNIESKFN